MLREVASNESSTVRWRIAHVLGGYPSHASMVALVHLIDDPDVYVRHGAARSLAEMACLATPRLREIIVDVVKQKIDTLMRAEKCEGDERARKRSDSYTRTSAEK